MGDRGRAFVSLTTNDSYAQGAVALGTSLKRTSTTASLVLFIGEHVSQSMRLVLSGIWDELIDTETISSGDRENLALMCRPELGITLTKLRAWTLVQFEKCVFMDADTLVLCNVDELFDRPELSAARDTGWPDCFNSGVFVFEPSLVTYDLLLKHMVEHGSFDGGDQGLLNAFFGERWQQDLCYHLPFTYNTVATITYTYAPAFKRFGDDMKVVHFLGSQKPWFYSYNSSSRSIGGMPSTALGVSRDLVSKWWEVFLSAKGQSASLINGSIPAAVPEEPPLSTVSVCDEDKIPQPCDQTHSTATAQSADGHYTRPGEQGSEHHTVPDEGALTSGMAAVSLEAPSPAKQTEPAKEPELTEEQKQQMRKQDWERGNIDYTGRDKFSNIARALEKSMSNEDEA